MANNRLYIVCRGCNGFMAFAKFYPVDEGSGWYSTRSGEDFDNFFDEHGKCNKMDNYGSFWDVVDEDDKRVKQIDMVERKIYISNREV